MAPGELKVMHCVIMTVLNGSLLLEDFILDLMVPDPDISVPAWMCFVYVMAQTLELATLAQSISYINRRLEVNSREK